MVWEKFPKFPKEPPANKNFIKYNRLGSWEFLLNYLQLYFCGNYLRNCNSPGFFSQNTHVCCPNGLDCVEIMIRGKYLLKVHIFIKKATIVDLCFKKSLKTHFYPCKFSEILSLKIQKLHAELLNLK